MNGRQRAIVWLLVLIMMLPGLAFASRKGRLIGKVLDPDGHPVAGVSVTTTSKDIPNFRKVTTTNKKGVFKVDFARLFVTYQLKFEKAGFHSFESEQDWKLEGTGRDEFVMHPGNDSAATDLPPVSASVQAIDAFNLGVSAYEAKHFGSALAKFEEAIKADPELHQAWGAMSVIYLEQGENEKAVDFAEKAMAHGSTSETVLRARWEAYRNLGDEAKAEAARKDLEKVAQLAEEAKKIYNEGVALTKAGDDEAAFARFKEAADIDPNLKVALIGLATCGVKIGQNEAAAAAAKTVLDADPKNEQAIRLQYNACLGLGDEDKLIDSLGSLALVEPRIARDSLLKLAFDSYDANDMPAAKTRFLKVVEVDPNFAQPHYYLATISVGQSANDDAILHLERFLALAPDDPQAPTAQGLLDYLKKK